MNGSSDTPVSALLESRRDFLRFLERRVGDAALAEDLLQDAFAKVVARPDMAPDEAVVRWFYRILRNAAIDAFRRRAVADRTYAAFVQELQSQEHTAPSDLDAEICACVTRLASTLKPEYAEALSAVEIAGTPVKVFAEQKGLSANNAAVRVFRARAALKKRVAESCGLCATHGCVDCTCGRREDPRTADNGNPTRVGPFAGQ